MGEFLKKYIDHMDRADSPLQDILDKGRDSKLLLENPAFKQAVRDVYWKLTLWEDEAIGDVMKDPTSSQQEARRLAEMRCLLTTLLQMLDQSIVEAENARVDPANAEQQSLF